jgi:hypothetical protein
MSINFTLSIDLNLAAALWHCGTVALWPCGTVALWHCGTVALWPCGTVALWPCGPVDLWTCGPVALWPCGPGALGWTQPPTEMSTRNLPASKGWPKRKAEHLTGTCEPISYKVSEPRVSRPCGPPRTVIAITLLFYMKMILLPHRKHTCAPPPPQPVTVITLLCYM